MVTIKELEELEDKIHKRNLKEQTKDWNEALVIAAVITIMFMIVATILFYF